MLFNWREKKILKEQARKLVKKQQSEEKLKEIVNYLVHLKPTNPTVFICTKVSNSNHIGYYKISYGTAEERKTLTKAVEILKKYWPEEL